GLPLPRISIFSQSLNLRHSLLATGEFLTMIPGSVLRFGPDRAAIKVLAVTTRRWRFATWALTRKNRTLTPLAQRSLDCVRDHAAPQANPGLFSVGVFQAESFAAERRARLAPRAASPP